MKNIKVLGTGCAKCKSVVALIEKLAADTGADIQLEKIEDIQKIISYNVMSTPAVIIDDQVVHSGGIPTADAVKAWLSS